MGMLLILAPTVALGQEAPAAVDKTIEALRVEQADTAERVKKIETALQTLISRTPVPPPPTQKQVDDAVKAIAKQCPKGTKYLAIDTRANGGAQCIVKL